MDRQVFNLNQFKILLHFQPNFTSPQISTWETFKSTQQTASKTESKSENDKNDADCFSMAWLGTIEVPTHSRYHRSTPKSTKFVRSLLENVSCWRKFGP